MPSKVSMEFAAAQGGLFGAVIGGTVGFLRSAGRRDAKNVAIGAGIGAVIGAGTLLLADVIGEAIVGGVSGKLNRDAPIVLDTIVGASGAPNRPMFRPQIVATSQLAAG